MTIFNPLPELPKLLPERPYRGVMQPYVSPMTESEIQEYLEDMGDIQRTLDLWNRVSRLSGILEGTVRESDPLKVKQQASRLVDIYYDHSIGFWRYVKSGYRIYPSRVRLGVLRISKFSERAMRELTRQLVNGEISREAWYRAMSQMMKDEYRAAYLASIGGLQNYTRSEISKFGWRMRPHYRWLNNFLEELNSGKQPLNGFAIVRAGMYGRAANAIFWNQNMRIAEEDGFDEVRRILGPNENHCEETVATPGCPELAAEGWVDMYDYVPIGGATCLSNCLCTLEFRRRE